MFKIVYIDKNSCIEMHETMEKKYRGTEVMVGVLVAECVWYSNNTTAAVFGH